MNIYQLKMNLKNSVHNKYYIEVTEDTVEECQNFLFDNDFIWINDEHKINVKNKNIKYFVLSYKHSTNITHPVFPLYKIQYCEHLYGNRNIVIPFEELNNSKIYNFIDETFKDII